MRDLFDKKLFKEAFRQIRLTFSLFLGLFLGIAALITIFSILSSVESYKLDKIVITYNVSEVLFMLYVAFLIVVPVFTFKLFKFLTKRNASDFYHAIPVKRKTILFTYGVAILAATAIIMILYTIIPTVAFSIAKKYISFDVTEALIFTLNTFACVFLVLGLCLLSSSLTGTFFTNMAFLLIIGFGPRLIISSITTSISNNLHELISYKTNYGFFSPDINLLFSTIFGEMFYNYDFHIYRLEWSTLYTFILGIIYIILAFAAFSKRHSEQAENSSRNPLIQHILRTCIGFVFGLAATISLSSFSNEDMAYAYIVIIGYGFAAICGMIGFELLTTKKVKNLLNLFVSIPIILILCFSTNIIISTAESNILSYTPDASRVDAVKCLSDSNNYGDGYAGNYYTYLLYSVKFDDEELIDSLIELYNEQMVVFRDYYKNDTQEWFGAVYGKDYEISISFIEGNKEINRIIYLNQKEYDAIMNLVYADDDYKKLYQSLPEKYNIHWGNEGFSKSETDKIMSALEKELKELSYENLLATISSDYYLDNIYFEFNCETYMDGRYLDFDVKIGNHTPKTLDTIFNILRERDKDTNDNINTTLDSYNLLNISNPDNCYYYLRIRVFNAQTSEAVYEFYVDEYLVSEFENYGLNADSFEDFDKALKDFFNAAGDDETSDYIVIVNLDSSLLENYGELLYHFYIDDCEALDTLYTMYYEY